MEATATLTATYSDDQQDEQATDTVPQTLVALVGILASALNAGMEIEGSMHLTMTRQDGESVVVTFDTNEITTESEVPA